MVNFKIVSSIHQYRQCVSIIISREYTYRPLYSLRMMQVAPIIYPTLQSILDVFHNDKYKSDEDVNKLLTIYLDAEKNAKTAVKRHPLIVLEGLDLSGKSTLSRKLASKINAQHLQTPPNAISASMREVFNDKSELRSAFYSLGNYIAAFQMLETLETKPVVLDRYWHSTAAYALAVAVQNSPDGAHLPTRGDEVYQWPSDLLKPDRVLFLSVSEDERIRRHNRRKVITSQEQLLKNNHTFRQNVLLAYQYMEDPSVQIINGDPVVNVVLKSLRLAVKDLVPNDPMKNTR